MPYITLPPEAFDNNPPTHPSLHGTSTLSPKQAWRRQNLLNQLKNITLVAETADLLQQQFHEIHSAFAPRNGWQDWLTATIATIMLRINRAERIERKLRDMASYRAIDFWDDDQKLEVETLAVKIAQEPAKVLAKLRQTPAGVDWLIARWRILARVEPQDWSDPQRELAARLTGGDSAVTPSDLGFVAKQIDDLGAHRERIVEADAIIRSLVEMDLHDDGVPGLAKLRRYVRSLHRQLKWYIDQFHVDHGDRWDDPKRRAASEGPAYERYRPRDPNLFEGKPGADFDETKPIAPVVEIDPNREVDETKPLSTAASDQNDETKPFEPAAEVQAMPTQTPAVSRPPALVHDYSNERGRNHSRALKAGEHSREYA